MYMQYRISDTGNKDESRCSNFKRFSVNLMLTTQKIPIKTNKMLSWSKSMSLKYQLDSIQRQRQNS